MPKVSVIIPCFNLGKYIHEAINSVLAQTFRDFEIIVVNDGSTDAETNSILDDLNRPEIRLINTSNQGLASARNNGIGEAKGKYILPLDADDKIAPSYLEKAVRILDENENIGIVYCRAERFDQENSKWDLPEYEFSKILIDNLIFCSALFRAADWKRVGGYKPSMIYGWEDYEFWLSIIELQREVCRIPEYLFFYRKRTDSMVSVMSREHLFYSYKEIIKHHRDLYFDNIEHIFQYIYSLRDSIAEQQATREAEVSNLSLEISNLNQKISDLKKQLSSPRGLLKLLRKSIVEKISF